MKILDKITSPILNMFEQGDGAYAYEKSYRVILLIVGVLFSVLAAGLGIVIFLSGRFGAFLPFLIFSGAALVCLVVSLKGSDRAVSKIWGKHQP